MKKTTTRRANTQHALQSPHTQNTKKKPKPLAGIRRRWDNNNIRMFFTETWWNDVLWWDVHTAIPLAPHGYLQDWHSHWHCLLKSSTYTTTQSTVQLIDQSLSKIKSTGHLVNWQCHSFNQSVTQPPSQWRSHCLSVRKLNQSITNRLVGLSSGCE